MAGHNYKPELDRIYNGEEIWQMPTPSFCTVIPQKKSTDLIFWDEILTVRYPTVDITSMNISATLTKNENYGGGALNN